MKNMLRHLAMGVGAILLGFETGYLYKPHWIVVAILIVVLVLLVIYTISLANEIKNKEVDTKDLDLAIGLVEATSVCEVILALLLLTNFAVGNLFSLALPDWIHPIITIVGGALAYGGFTSREMDGTKKDEEIV